MLEGISDLKCQSQPLNYTFLIWYARKAATCKNELLPIKIMLNQRQYWLDEWTWNCSCILQFKTEYYMLLSPVASQIAPFQSTSFSMDFTILCNDRARAFAMAFEFILKISLQRAVLLKPIILFVDWISFASVENEFVEWGIFFELFEEGKLLFWKIPTWERKHFVRVNFLGNSTQIPCFLKYTYFPWNLIQYASWRTYLPRISRLHGQSRDGYFLRLTCWKKVLDTFRTIA